MNLSIPGIKVMPATGIDGTTINVPTKAMNDAPSNTTSTKTMQVVQTSESAAPEAPGNSGHTG